MAKQLTTGEFSRRNFRWRERLLFLMPFIFLLLEMFQLPLATYYKNNIDASRQQNVFSLLPTIHDLIPIIGFLAAVAIVHIVLTIFFPKADQMLFPIVALLSGLGVLMALRNGPDAYPSNE